MAKKRLTPKRGPVVDGVRTCELKEVFVPGPKSIRNRIRLALAADIMRSEDQIKAAMRRQTGGEELFRDYGDQLGAIKVQASQLRKELQEAAGIEGNRRTAEGREEIGRKWKALPLARRKEIIARWDERAAAWMSEYGDAA